MVAFRPVNNIRLGILHIVGGVMTPCNSIFAENYFSI